jgi:hypothetical protein
VADVPPIMLEVQADVKNLETGIKTAIGQLKTLESAVNKSGNAAKEMSVKTVAAGSVVGNVLTQVGAKALSFGKEFVTTYLDIAKQTKQLQRVLGGSAEDMSRLRFAAEELGVSTETVSKSMRILSGHLTKNDEQAKALGISYRDAGGKILPSTVILSKLADRFKSMPAGIERTALAVKAFGRSGTEMLPFLSRGSEGLQELYNTADRFGLTLDKKGIDAATRFNLNMKEMHAQVQGAQLQIGENLVPKLMTMVNVLRDVIDKVINFTKNNQTLVKIIGGLAVGFVALYTAIKVFTAVSKMAAVVTEGLSAAFALLGLSEETVIAPIIGIIAAIVALVAAFVYAYKHSETFRDVVSKAIEAVATYIGKAVGYIAKALKLIGDLWISTITLIAKGAAALAPILNKVGIHVLDGAGGWVNTLTAMKSKMDSTLGSLAEKAPLAGANIGKSLAKGLDKAMNFDIKGYISGLSKKYKIDLPSGGTGDVAPDGTTTGTGTSSAAKGKARAISEASAYISAMQQMRKRIDAEFAFDKTKVKTPQQALKLGEGYLHEVRKMLELAKAEEKKTRGTKDHAKAMALLTAELKDYAKAQTYISKSTAAIAKEEKQKADAVAQATAALNAQIAAMSNSQSAANSWLAAQTRASGPTAAQFTGSINIPVVIDGQTVFRATQRASLLNNRRNPSNGQTISGGLI